MTSTYFTFVDADDWLELNAYEEMLKLSEYGCDLIQCGCILTIEGEPLRYIPLESKQKIFQINNEKERKDFFPNAGYRE